MMFKPFENGTESSAIYDLTLENQTDCVSLYGNLQITKDQDGLKTAKALQEKNRPAPGYKKTLLMPTPSCTSWVMP